MNPPPPLLQVNNLAMRFGGLLAVSDVTFSLNEGQIMAIIGPNGAGKTTAFNCISGFYRPSCGTIRFKGEVITTKPSHVIARRGLVRTFQNIRLFSAMTVLENLLVAQHTHLNTHLLSGLLQTRHYRRKEQEAIEHALKWLNIMQLSGVVHREAGNLAYGQQRKLEIARCMVTRPQLLLLDEPAAGLNPSETAELTQLIRYLRDEHRVTVLIIEHDMKLVMTISEQILVLDRGIPIAAGNPAAIQQHPEVIRAYLGDDG
ncbi:high-affinity branched-chain amino acid ABC transporter ATP-binding protein LivG [Ectothiorhodospiraceae bacterium BW-2]|nr:high-affinity branched-chain amino acid ABC transporter ATP-binding protein LivG [Ectothiorhodospiraceae bacterium BW-2]